jgi:hypothetical protein
MSPAVVVRSLASGFAVVALTACSGGLFGPGRGASSDTVGPSGPATAETRNTLEMQQDCRRRVDQALESQNRPAIYAANPSMNTPFSANYVPSVVSSGLTGHYGSEQSVAQFDLANQFGYERSVAECEHNSSTGNDQPNTPPPPAARGP